MEHIDLRKKRRDLIFKVLAIAILLFIAYQLILINKKVREHYEAFDENPLLFGMKKYGIVEARGTTEKGYVIFFTQDRIWQENIKGSKNINFSIKEFEDIWGNLTS